MAMERFGGQGFPQGDKITAKIGSIPTTEANDID